MGNRIVLRIAFVAAIALLWSTQASAQTRAEGIINDFTATLDPGGPWHINGPWALFVNSTTGAIELEAALAMVRSDNETRQSHTHHIRMTNGGVTPIEGGFRINGTASITVNGVAAAFTNSPVEIEITGGAAVALSNFKVTFSGGGAGHFGDQPLDGVVTVLR